MPFQENSYDVVYSIEATVHAPFSQGVYHEIYKALRAGGVFGVYEWFMTDKYDNDNVQQRQLRFAIEEEDGISNIVTVSEGTQTIKDAGFELL
ncbi:hypothetical protein BP5796_03674 [Coleophoma crateriformis]|uniref:SAM-dependent methyltransferase Erg6/SMT-type domain-containing protein n=1 Tax=Coleophoma crateriformis TaxID=565419 RepID=A0A3D8SG72_9HELO|nr:hypothetical protein BP5796_03674 [Coleophoma crateriformis]